jgi:hypothetical protein
MLKHVVSISKEMEEISVIKRKMDNCWDLRPEFEQQLWQKYTRITQFKNDYFRAKLAAKHTPLNAYVTFRAQPAKDRVLKAYDVNDFLRRCDPKDRYIDLDLLQEGYIKVGEAVDPKILTWEHLRQPRTTKVMRHIAGFLVTLALFLTSFFGIRGIYRTNR